MNMIVDRSYEDGSITPSKRHYVAFVLDRSGSMGPIKQATIDGFNQQLEAIRKEADGNTRISLTTFGSEVTPIYFNRHITRAENLNHLNYRPEGWTALYDAVAYTVNRLSMEAEYAQDATYLIVVVSDGYENYSREYNMYRIANLVKSKQQTGRWTFVYIGSNQDLGQVSASLGISITNTMPFINDQAGTSKMFGVSANALCAYMTSVKSDQYDSTDSYFSGSGGANLTTTTDGNSLDSKVVTQ